LTWVPEGVGGIRTGRLLAFAEKRHGIGDLDHGNITIAMRVSKDGGFTWSPIRELFSPRQVGIDRSSAVIGNPTVVVDRRYGVVILLFVVQYAQESEKDILEGKSKGSRWIFTSRSVDGGSSWSLPQNITDYVKKPHWTWYAIGPGAAIQLTATGPFEGRLVAPCNHVDGDRFRAQHRAKRSHLIYSDDGGKTWRLGARMSWDTNECAVAELKNGSLLVNSRDWSRRHQRVQHVSHDGGQTVFGEKFFSKQLNEPKPHGCQAAMVSAHHRGADLSPLSGKNCLLVFSNPSALTRRNLTVKVSNSNGRRWVASHRLYTGLAGYSALAVLPGSKDADEGFAVGCLFERGVKNFYDTIAFTVMPGAQLLAPARVANFSRIITVATPPNASSRSGNLRRRSKVSAEKEAEGGKHRTRARSKKRP